ncbi:TPA: hypothetical protein HL486_20460 [Escherichia coli]|nr:hypothetical protein [Escherichia coli]
MTAPLASRLISAICAGSPEKCIRFEHQFGMGILLSHAASIRPCRTCNRATATHLHRMQPG